MAQHVNQYKRIVADNDTPAGRAFDLFFQAIILLSLITFSIETLPGLSPSSRQALYRIEVATVALFTVEYLLRVWAAPRRIRFVLSFYGLIDLLAILPFYLGTAVDLRAVRVLRFMRLFRLLKFARYTQALERFRTALGSIRAELTVFLFVSFLFIYVASVGTYYFERDAQPDKFASVFHALWWSVITLTTVGYGDVYPVTVGGRVFTGVLVLLGLAIVAVPSGLLAAALTRTEN